MVWPLLIAGALAADPLAERAAEREAQWLAALEVRLDGQTPAPALAGMHHRLGEARRAALHRSTWDNGWEQQAADVTFAFATVLLDDPGYSRMDEVLWALAVDADVSAPTRIEMLSLLLEAHPDSTLAPSAQLMLGDLRLDFGETYDPAAALRHYDAVLVQDAPAHVTDFARYRRGWCLYLLDQEDAAIGELEALARDLRTGPLRQRGFADTVVRELLGMVRSAGLHEEVVPMVLSLYRDPQVQRRILDRYARALAASAPEADQAAFAQQRQRNGR